MYVLTPVPEWQYTKRRSRGRRLDDNVLAVDGLGTIEMDLDQLGCTTKPVKMVSVRYMPGL